MELVALTYTLESSSYAIVSIQIYVQIKVSFYTKKKLNWVSINFFEGSAHTEHLIRLLKIENQSNRYVEQKGEEHCDGHHFLLWNKIRLTGANFDAYFVSFVFSHFIFSYDHLVDWISPGYSRMRTYNEVKQ